MRFLLAVLALCTAVSGTPGSAQSWGNLDALLMGTLTESGQAEASFWLPNAANPGTATLALGFAYEYIPGSAGNTGIAIGAYVKGAEGWEYAGRVNGIFGRSPRDAAFGQGFADVTTTTLGPGEPRCCPTAQTRWRVDFSTLTAQRLN